MKLAKYCVVSALMAIFYISLGGGCANKNQWPRVVIIKPGLSSHVVEVNYILSDKESNSVRIKAYYSTDGLIFENATMSLIAEEFGLDTTKNLSSNSSGIRHIFYWDSYHDIKGGVFNEVYFRIIPRDKDLGKEKTTDKFFVDNSVNESPSCGVNISENDIYDWFDNWSVVTGLNLLDDTDGGSIYWNYTIGPGTTTIGMLDMYRDSGMTELIASGTADTTDCSNRLAFNSVGGSSLSGDVDVDPRFPPAIFFYDYQGGDFDNYFTSWWISEDIDYADFDTTAVPGNASVFIDWVVSGQSVTLTFYSDIALTATLATGFGSKGEIIDFGDNNSSFSGSVEVSSIIENHPSPAHFNFFSFADVTGYIHIESAVLPPPQATELNNSGFWSISYYLVDMDNDSVDVEINFSVNGGLPFKATEVAGNNLSEGLEFLSATDQGSIHTFIWNSLVDIGYVKMENIVIVVFPKDATSSGTSRSTDAFVVDNINK